MQIFIQLTTLLSVLLKNMFVHFFGFTRGDLIHGGRIYWFKGKFETKSYIVAVVCKKLECDLVICWGLCTLPIMLMLLWPLRGLWFWYGRVCSFCCCLPRWSQVLHGNTDFLLYISDSLIWLTNHNIRQWSCRLVRPRNDTLNLISRLAEFSFLPF